MIIIRQMVGDHPFIADELRPFRGPTSLPEKTPSLGTSYLEMSE